MNTNDITSEMTLILSLYPNPRGLGYVCVELPEKLVEAGVITVRPVCNDKVLKRVETFIEFFNPKVVVVRDYDMHSNRNERLMKLTGAITRFAKEKNLPVYRYSRQQIRDVFEVLGNATTKYEIAHKIIEWFPALADRAPKIRKPWMDEDYNMGIFDAMALAIAHEYLTQ